MTQQLFVSTTRLKVKRLMSGKVAVAHKPGEAYLKEQYARIPRIKMSRTAHIGWKCRVIDHKDKYIQVQWFPADYGKVL